MQKKSKDLSKLIGLISTGSLQSRTKSIKWLKGQLRNAKWDLEKKKQIQDALNMAKQMTEEQFRYEVDKFINQSFYQNMIWK